MIVEDMLFATLSGVAAISARTTGPKGIRIGPKGGLPEDGTNGDAISLERISAVATDDLTSGGDLDLTRMQVDAWSATPRGASTLATLIRDKLAPEDDPGIGVLAFKRGPALDIESRTWRVQQDFMIWEERN